MIFRLRGFPSLSKGTNGYAARLDILFKGLIDKTIFFNVSHDKGHIILINLGTFFE